MGGDDPVTEKLLRLAGEGDRIALGRLFGQYRDRLKRMIAVRIDQRLRSRADASDVVQDTLAEGAARLMEYLERRPMPFYLWLRQLAFQRLVDISRRHIRAQRRGVGREADQGLPLSDESAMALANRLMASGTTPSGRMQREELRRQVQAALERLPLEDREVLVLRHLEELSMREVATVLGITEPMARYRQRRALERLGDLLPDPITGARKR